MKKDKKFRLEILYSSKTEKPKNEYVLHAKRHLSYAAFSENIDGNRYSKDKLPLCWKDFFDNFSILKYMCIIYDDRIDEPWYYLSGKEQLK